MRTAKIIRAPRGPGSTDVIIASTARLPSSELIAAVEANLYEHELMSFDVQVKPPETVAIIVTIEFSGAADEADVALIAETYVHNLDIGGSFSIRELYALYEPLALPTIEIISPVRDVQAPESSIIVATISASKISEGV